MNSWRKQKQLLHEHNQQVAWTPHGLILLPLDWEDRSDHAAHCGAIAEIQRVTDYRDDCHVGGAIDAVLARARRQLEETQALVQQLVERGLRLKVMGETLWVGPGNKVDDEVTRLVRENKARLMAVLGG